MSNEAPARKTWMFTLFNYTDEDEERLQSLDIIDFIIYQHEICPKTDRPHLQGYLELKSKARLLRCKDLIGIPGIHLDPRYGSLDQAIAYCSKEDSRDPDESLQSFERGTRVGQGKRNDLIVLKEDIDSGATLPDLYESHFSNMIRYSKGIEKYVSLKAPPRDFKSEVYIITGPTGVGKSREVHERWPAAYYFSAGNNCWFDGYQQQEVVVFDDFAGNQVPFKLLLRICDRLPLTVEIKGGSVNFAPKLIVFTSIQPPHEWYDYSRLQGFAQMERRITAWKSHAPHSTPEIPSYVWKEYEEDPILCEDIPLDYEVQLE